MQPTQQTQPVQTTMVVQTQMVQQPVQAAPVQGAQTTSSFGEFGGNDEYGGARLDYSKPVYNDLWAMIVFYLHIVLLIVIIIVGFSGQDSGNDDDDDDDSGSGSTSSAAEAFFLAIIMSLVIGGLVGIVFGLVWLQVMKMFAEQIIKGMLFLNIFCWVVIIIWGLTLENGMGIVVIGVIGALVMCLYTYCVWSRIPFASALLSISSQIASTYQGTVMISLLTCVMDLIWFVIWIFAYFGYGAMTGEAQYPGIVNFIYILSLYWGFYVFKNVSHTTTCGVAATWYFSAQPHKPTNAAFKRTMTTSFGSVCFGSLIVAFLRALRAMLGSKKSAANCIAACLLLCIERLMRYFNTYAFAQVAIYGVPFIEAAKATWNLFLARGIDAIIKDNLTGLALTCGAFFGFVISVLAAYFIAYAILEPEFDEPIAIGISVILAIYGGIIGYGLCILVLTVVQSSVVCLFVCFAEDPAALQRVRPDSYDRLVGAHDGMRVVATGQAYTTA